MIRTVDGAAVRQAPQRYALREMRIELLRGCPLRCVHCSAHAAPLHPLQLAAERVSFLVDEFAALGGERVTFTGGEPLAYPGLHAILDQCHLHGIATRLFSSGVILDGRRPSAALQIIDRLTPSLDGIVYSLYAAYGPTHEAITRVAGSFALTLESIRHTVAAGIQTDLHFVPTHGNHRDLPDIVELADKLGVRRISVLRFVPHGRGRRRSDALALDAPAHAWLRSTIADVRVRHPRITVAVGSAYNLLHVGEPTACTAGIDQLVIEATGNIIPCSAFAGYHIEDPVGNINDAALRDVWERSSYLGAVRRTLQQNNTCEGCLAQKTLASGRIDASVVDPLEHLLRRDEQQPALSPNERKACSA